MVFADLPELPSLTQSDHNLEAEGGDLNFFVLCFVLEQWAQRVKNDRPLSVFF